MKIRIVMACCIAGTALAAGACSMPATKTTNTSTTTSTSNSGGATGGKALGTKPSGNAKPRPTAKIVPAPTEWATMYNDGYGYEFKIPDDYKETANQLDNGSLFLEVPPVDDGTKPFVLLLAFKDKTLSRDDLLKLAENILQGKEGESSVTVETPTDLGDDYSLATFTSVDKDKKKIKGKVLVATDLTDNYVMFIGVGDASFASNEKTIDEIWGSFTMYSGGSTGKS